MSRHAPFVQEVGAGTAAADLDDLATASVPAR
jgi:hypothetical protein